MRAIMLSAASVLVLAVVAVPASATQPSRARVSGRYRVVYVHVAGKAYAGGTSVFRWSTVPTCARGPCATQVQSRYESGKPSMAFTFAFDGTTYRWGQRVKGAEGCTASDGRTAPIEKAYDVAIVSRFRVTRMSSSGRALVFKGTFSTRFVANARGRAHGCGYYTDTEHFTGRAITTP